MYILSNIEFYNTPCGDVIIKEVGQPARVLKEQDRELIAEMLAIISDRYPQSHRALMDLYSKSSMNRTYYEYRVVHRFIRCNFGEFDQLNYDINAFGQFNFEEVKCPLRGECPLEGVVCKPEIDLNLTDREMEVFRLIASNMKTEEIAAKLSISKFTIIRHRENIKARLGLHDIPEMITYWHVNHLK